MALRNDDVKAIELCQSQQFQFEFDFLRLSGGLLWDELRKIVEEVDQ
jgi:hypothetical protein